jgi:hypothetical protein
MCEEEKGALFRAGGTVLGNEIWTRISARRWCIDETAGSFVTDSTRTTNGLEKFVKFTVAE